MSYSTVFGVLFEGMPYVSAFVHLPGQNRGGIVHFQIDTGSDRTTICPADAEVLGINFGELALPLKLGTIGSEVLAHEEEAVLTFAAATELTMFQTTVCVLNPSTSRIARSLLGMDVIRRCSLYSRSDGVALTPVEVDAVIARQGY
jgi:predicted aspartyl protease